ncbi:hypothetical protein ABH935_004910 [Catenulispora sp. GAS73]|uniref:hypothetical protein n=1 Tax=Catenulispora sp. GAS73 TaxID=3156269 RepID=UPI0035114E30
MSAYVAADAPSAMPVTVPPLPDVLQTNTTFTLKIPARFPRVADSGRFDRIPAPEEFAFEHVGEEPRRLEAAPFA